jgi:multicomponent Na+:H+ antiporter subunit D
VLNIAYFFPILKRAYFNENKEIEKYGEASMLMVIPIIITAILSVAFGLSPNLFFNFFNLAVKITNNLSQGFVL